MKVRDIMTQPPQTCRLETDLATASRRMKENMCGTLAVLDKRGRVVGMVTDRDLAMSLGETTHPPAYIRVEEVMSASVHSCSPDEDVRRALARMAAFRLRRLPVVNTDGDVKGVLSIDDVILWGVDSHGISANELASALRSICAPQAALLEPA